MLKLPPPHFYLKVLTKRFLLFTCGLACMASAFGQYSTVSATYDCYPTKFIAGNTLSVKQNSNGTTLNIGSTASDGRVIVAILWFNTSSGQVGTGNAYTVSTSNTYYALLAFNTGSSVQASSIAITILTPNVVISGPSSILPGQSVTYTAQIPSELTTYKNFILNWQVNGVSPTSNYSSSTFTTNTLKTGDVVRLYYYSYAACGFSGTSNSITVSIPIWNAGTGATAYADPSLNIGIGTATPSQKLEVAGNIKATGLVFPDGTSQTTANPFSYSNTTVSLKTQNTWTFQGSMIVVNWGQLLNRVSIGAPLAVSGGVTIGGETNSSGNFKIPTTDTDYLLAVQGKIVGREIVVSGPSNWADYVFEDDYKLPSLSEIEKYLKINKHLKDIPSSKVVAEKGVNLAEMDAKLLQQIEHLMLHVIRQQKEIESLKAKSK